jgi:hypothetical protein
MSTRPAAIFSPAIRCERAEAAPRVTAWRCGGTVSVSGVGLPSIAQGEFLVRDAFVIFQRIVDSYTATSVVEGHAPASAP